MLNATSGFHRRALPIALAAIVLVFILWNVPFFDFVLYPFRLFVTFVHESGHGLAALITGGRFIEFTVNSDGSGLAQTAGGSRALILPAGYLGAALFGAALFYLANTIPHSRVLSVGLGVLVILITVLFTNLLTVAFFVGLLMGAVLIFIGRRAHEDITTLVLNVLAVLTGLNAVFDLLMLMNNSNIGMGSVRNDAAAFSAEIAPLVPPAAWAFLWCALAILMLGAAVYYSLIHPIRRNRV